MGDWQGGNIVDRGDPPANLEPLADLSARCLKWWNDSIARHAQRHGARARPGLGSPLSLEGGEETALEVDPELEPAHILVVSHGGLIGTLVKGLLGSRKVRAAEGVICFGGSLVGVPAYRELVLEKLRERGHVFRRVEFIEDAAATGARGLASAARGGEGAD